MKDDESAFLKDSGFNNSFIMERKNCSRERGGGREVEIVTGPYLNTLSDDVQLFPLTTLSTLPPDSIPPLPFFLAFPSPL